MAIGWMAEWSKAAVLKTVEVQASGGSNPSPSVHDRIAQWGSAGWMRFSRIPPTMWTGATRSDGRAVEGASLLRKYTGNGIRGSNPRHSEVRKAIGKPVALCF